MMVNKPIAKLSAVKKLLEKLTEDLNSNSLQPQGRFQYAKSFGRLVTKFGVERDASLEELKVYGRDPSYAAPIFTKEVRRVLPTS
jgi:hypothetical protein